MPGVLTYDESFLAHDAGTWHPESPSRLEAIRKRLAARPDLSSGLTFVEAPEAPAAAILAVHERAYYEHLERLDAAGGGHLDPDTAMSSGSLEAARRAAGAGLAGIEAVDAGADFAYALVRPPGHHAVAQQGMGFCLLNNASITAFALRARGERVAIFDWDAHHGNGTQDIFYADPEVLYVSAHEFPQYPGTGRPGEAGTGAGSGTTLNLAFPPGTGEHTYLRAFDEVVAPVVRCFDPTWMIISAGYDAHHADPLTSMGLRSRSFALLSRRVRELAADVCDGRILAFLEGGYDLDALADSVEVTLWELGGADSDAEARIETEPATPDASSRAESTIDVARTVMSAYWDI